MEFLIFGGIPLFFGENRTFPVLGLENTSQNLTFIKGFAPGAQKSILGPKSAFLGPEMLKREEFHHFWGNGPEALKIDRKR